MEEMKTKKSLAIDFNSTKMPTYLYFIFSLCTNQFNYATDTLIMTTARYSKRFKKLFFIVVVVAIVCSSSCGRCEVILRLLKKGNEKTENERQIYV